MASGIEGTGPYARIRTLQNEIKNFQYEISLIDQGMRRQFSRKKYEGWIKEKREEVSKIKKEIKENKKPPIRRYFDLFYLSATFI